MQLHDLERRMEYGPDHAYWRVLGASFAEWMGEGVSPGAEWNSVTAICAALFRYRGRLMDLSSGGPHDAHDRMMLANQAFADEFSLFCNALLGD